MGGLGRVAHVWACVGVTALRELGVHARPLECCRGGHGYGVGGEQGEQEVRLAAADAGRGPQTLQRCSPPSSPPPIPKTHTLPPRHAGRQVCRDLAHLYHYYLHGEQGGSSNNNSGGGGGGGPLPDIVLRVVMLGQELWRCNLAEVGVGCCRVVWGLWKRGSSACVVCRGWAGERGGVRCVGKSQRIF